MNRGEYSQIHDNNRKIVQNINKRDISFTYNII